MSATTKLREHKCADGRCPVGIDSLREISLTPHERLKIFSTLKAEIYELKKKRYLLLNQPSL